MLLGAITKIEEPKMLTETQLKALMQENSNA